ncbi:hypothetical protein F4859DRAFT_317010 [Xylaria cf. heliscus]|nr:hypothetical protein F4859DRAFT_317010 [Xylaria cf. heliscus]
MRTSSSITQAWASFRSLLSLTISDTVRPVSVPRFAKPSITPFLSLTDISWLILNLPPRRLSLISIPMMFFCSSSTNRSGASDTFHGFCLSAAPVYPITEVSACSDRSDICFDKKATASSDL